MPVKKKVVASGEDVIISQRNCQRIVNDQEIEAIFGELQDAYLRAFTESLPAETEKRELAYRNSKAVSDVWKALKRKAQGAKVRDLKEAQANG